MNPASQSNERLIELLADQAVFGLDAAEQLELESLQAAASQPADFRFELAAAKMMLAAEASAIGSPTADDAPPAGLAQRVAEDAAAFFAPAMPAAQREAAPRPRRITARELLSWMVAMAATGLAAFVWFGDRDSTKEYSLAEQRAQLAEATDALRIDWLPSKDPAAREASGDVVWSNQRQQGFMRIRNLQANDPSQRQYQLWIIDGDRNAAQPVDGGVFDVPPGKTEVIVPIAAKLRVYNPRAFAVTIERAGGVVVSQRERLPLLAPVEDQ